MAHPDNMNWQAYDRTHGGPSELFEMAADREYDYLLSQITREDKPAGSGLTVGQKAVCDLIGEDEIDGAIFAAIISAAKHLQNPKGITPERVGLAVIGALRQDLTAIAESLANDIRS